jgi:4-amino-4-deoxy-L-arabinose transferase-like glycosyltransferase
MVVLLHLAVVITLAIAALAAYIYFGSAKIANIAEINSQFKLLDEEILREEVAINRAPNTAVLPYCTDVESIPNPVNAAETVQRFHSVAQSHLCAKLGDLLQKQKIAYMNLSPWYTADDRSLPAELNVVSGYVLPVLMGLLGSMTYVLRRYLRSVGDRLLTPRDLREYIVRLVLGTVFGVAIGFFTTAENVIANPVSSLGAPALAFLAGYGVEAVFRMLDGLADQFSPARK